MPFEIDGVERRRTAGGLCRCARGRGRVRLDRLVFLEKLRLADRISDVEPHAIPPDEVHFLSKCFTAAARENALRIRAARAQRGKRPLGVRRRCDDENLHALARRRCIGSVISGSFPSSAMAVTSVTGTGRSGPVM